MTASDWCVIIAYLGGMIGLSVYWRGPTWVNTNWLLTDALGDDLVARTLELSAREGFREYYDPHTGDGLGATGFTWSAALVLDWLSR